MLGELLKLATTAIAARAADQGRRFPAAAACMIFAAGLLTAAIGCAISAGWIYLTPMVGPVGAPLIVGAILLLCCLILVGIGWRTWHPKHPPLPIIPTEAALGEVKHLLHEHKGAVLLAATIAGLVFGSGRR
jgi:putative effector of murein hydrolase